MSACIVHTCISYLSCLNVPFPLTISHFHLFTETFDSPGSCKYLEKEKSYLGIQCYKLIELHCCSVVSQ